MNLSSEARSTLSLLNSLNPEKSVLELAEVQVLISEGKRADASNLIQKAISVYSGKVKTVGLALTLIFGYLNLLFSITKNKTA